MPDIKSGLTPVEKYVRIPLAVHGPSQNTADRACVTHHTMPLRRS